MAHHLLPRIDREWLDRLDHAFLIRDPLQVLSSLVEYLPHPTLADTGLPQQVEIFERVERRTGRPAPVVDASDVVTRPEATLRRLCGALELEFTPAMLAWPAAPAAADGVWAKHWYGKVERSTGFAAQESTLRPLDPAVRHLAGECARYYERLAAHRLA
jgi:hypothetical protein